MFSFVLHIGLLSSLATSIQGKPVGSIAIDGWTMEEPPCTPIKIPTSTVCEEDWIQYNESCYLVVNEEESLETAKYHCSLKRSSLMVPDTREELFYVHTFACDWGATWTGLQREAGPKYLEGPISWNSDFFPFRRRECSSIANQIFFWHTCNEKNFYICERNSTVTAQNGYPVVRGNINLA